MAERDGSKQRALYETIQKLRKGVVETVLSGAHAGEKKYLETGKCGVTGIQEKDEKVFCELVSAEKELVVCGGGHVSIAVVRIAKMIGFDVTVLEDRPKFADDARRAGADRVICESFEKAMDGIPGNSGTFFVIATRGHRYDTVCLERALQKEYAYVGMMGSRRRVRVVLEHLEEQGVDRKILEGVHTPIGLPIAAETPEEIAVSVMAEIIQVKNKSFGGEGYSRELLNALTDEDTYEKGAVLATIVSRKGSAPRAVGTKMLVYREGMQIGTIGGGCMEAAILAKARQMLLEGFLAFQVMTVDMTGQEAQESGMVCGGVEEVMLELLGR